MKKKILSVMLAAALAGTLAGCSGELSNDYVTVTQYKGLEVPQVEQSDEVTDDQVQQMIDSNLAMQAGRETITDRPAQDGDIVNIDYTGTIAGEAFDGGSDVGAELQLGSGRFIGATEDYAGFEEQIVGHETGEEFDIQVQFPAEYSPNPAMSGVVADFHIVLNGIELETVPELTDEWVQENSEESETVDEYKEEIRASLEENMQASVQAQLESSVLQALLDKTEIKEYPEDVVNAQKEMYTGAYEQMAAMYGVELGTFLTDYMQTTEEQFNEEADEYAKQTAVLAEAVKLVAEKEHLEPSDKEYEEKIAEYAEESGYDDVDAFIEEVGEDAVRTQILQDAVAEYLADKCIQVEQSDDAVSE